MSVTVSVSMMAPSWTGWQQTGSARAQSGPGTAGSVVRCDVALCDCSPYVNPAKMEGIAWSLAVGNAGAGALRIGALLPPAVCAATQWKCSAQWEHRPSGRSRCAGTW